MASLLKKNGYRLATTTGLFTLLNNKQAGYNLKLTTSWLQIDHKLGLQIDNCRLIDKLSYKLIAEWTTNKLTATQPRPRTLTHLTNLAGITSLYLPNLPSDLAYLIICLSPTLNYNWLQLTNQDRFGYKNWMTTNWGAGGYKLWLWLPNPNPNVSLTNCN
jgi:hypothetical protein